MKVLILGATGSIGQNAIKVIKKASYQLVGISFNKNLKLAKNIINSNNLKLYYSPSYTEFSSTNSYDELIKKSSPDIVLNCVAGFAGLQATIACIKNKVDLALANKESLVIAGDLIKELNKKYQINIYPVDSEHAAIYQCLKYRNSFLKKIYITASGGPFYGYKKQALENISYLQAIKHPI